MAKRGCGREYWRAGGAGPDPTFPSEAGILPGTNHQKNQSSGQRRTSVETIGFIGLGQMGHPMTRNLMAAGHPCVVHDTDSAKMEALVQAGAELGRDAKDVASRVDVVFTCLPNGDVVEEVVTAPDGILAGCRPGQVFVDMSTNFPPISIRLAEQLSARGVEMLDAPISGGEPAAIEGSLSIMAGGKPAVFQRCLPLFQAMGKTVTLMGEQVGAGGYTKLSNQIMYAINLIGVVESLTFARKAGLDLEKVVAALSGGIAKSRVLEVKADKVIHHDWSNQGPVWMLRKDLTYITRSMKELGANLPISQVLLPFYEELYDAGLADADQSVVTELFEKLAGIGD